MSNKTIAKTIGYRGLQAMVWYWSVVEASGGKSALELEKQFGPSRKHPSCIWFKYRNGQSAPRDGRWGEKNMHLVDQVALVYPQTKFWWTCPLWRLLNPKPMGMDDIKAAFEWLPDDLKVEIFRDPPAAGQRQIFWRRRKMPIGIERRLLKKCVARQDIYGLTALVALWREAEIIQAEDLFESYSNELISYVSRCSGDVFPGRESGEVRISLVNMLARLIDRVMSM